MKTAFQQLQKGDDAERSLHQELERMFAKLEKNCFAGIQIPKKLIPKEYDCQNLWKYNLSGAWRLLYSVESDGILVLAIILEWLNHKDYEKRFNY